MAGRVEGKVAFITGAARGQGRSHAVRLAEEGADIIAVDICETIEGTPYDGASEADLEETVRLVEKLDRRIVATKADVRDHAALGAALDAGVHELGGLDIVVANAGIMRMQAWDEVTPADWSQMIDINLTGVWNTFRLGAAHLVERGGGSMIATSSVAGIKGMPWLSPYVVAKHGVVGLMRSFASELAHDGVRVNTVHPCGVGTDMAWGISPTMKPYRDKQPHLAPMWINLLDTEIVDPHDVSNAVLYLASDEARYVTSTELTVDAGNSQF